MHVSSKWNNLNTRFIKISVFYVLLSLKGKGKINHSSLLLFSSEGAVELFFEGTLLTLFSTGADCFSTVFVFSWVFLVCSHLNENQGDIWVFKGLKFRLKVPRFYSRTEMFFLPDRVIWNVLHVVQILFPLLSPDIVVVMRLFTADSFQNSLKTV